MFFSTHRSLAYATLHPANAPAMTPAPYQITGKCVAIRLPIHVTRQNTIAVQIAPVRSSK